MMRAYAGIGSRETPQDVLALMQAAARVLSALGFTLRSGHAPGADTAFEQGAQGKAEIYLPWSGFGASRVLGQVFPKPSKEALELAAATHPAWAKCSGPARLLHARNGHQILGQDLSNPVKFVLCWTKDGQASGGTGQAIRLAQARGIPIFNLHAATARERLERFVRRFRATFDGRCPLCGGLSETGYGPVSGGKLVIYSDCQYCDWHYEEERERSWEMANDDRRP